MSEVPIISVTLDDISDDEQTDKGSKLNINECHTDVEDIGSEGEKNYPLLKIEKTECNGAVTDVEDYTDSDDNGDEKDEIEYEPEISLNEFLDQGHVDEAANVAVSGKNVKNKLVKMQSVNKSPSIHAFNLAVETNVGGAVTDCEDMEASGEEDNTEDFHCEDDDKPIMLEGSNAIDIHDTISNKKVEKPCHKVAEVVHAVSSSDSEREGAKPKTSNKLYTRKHKKAEEFDKSDVENMVFSDEDSAYRRKSRIVPILPTPDKNEAEIMVMEASDDETPTEKKSKVIFPEINITFASESKPKKKEATKSKLLALPANNDEALTDVENLESSESSEEEEGACSKKPLRKNLIPLALIKSEALTDVEDFGDDGDDESVESEDEKQVDIGYALPSPVREMTLLKETKDGEPTARTSPMPDNMYLGFDDLEMDKGLTDVEDLSDEGDDYDEEEENKEYEIPILPEMEGGIIESSDHQTGAESGARGDARGSMSTMELPSPVCEPKTDTEDIFLNKTEKNECRKRRTKKHAHSSSHHHHHHHHYQHQHHQKQKTSFLDTKSIQQNQCATTDVEDLNVSDDDEVLKDKTLKQRRATLPAPSSNDNNEGKTDVEYMSGDDNTDFIRFPPENSSNYANLDCSKTTSKNSLGVRETNEFNNRVPVIRKISPSPDTTFPLTDTEDMQMISDADDEAYCRAQTATPMEITNALNESGQTQVHEISAGVFDHQKERRFMKGNRDINETHTDVEFLDEDGLNVMNGGE